MDQRQRQTLSDDNNEGTSAFVVPPRFILSYCHHLMSVFVVRPSFILSYLSSLDICLFVSPIVYPQ
jgi:hypothetical protein